MMQELVEIGWNVYVAGGFMKSLLMIIIFIAVANVPVPGWEN